MMKDKLKQIIEENAINANITNQQSLHEVFMVLQEVCQELELDFDLALDKAELEHEFPTSDCDHAHAYPTGYGAVFCPGCLVELVKGMVEVPAYNYAEKNLWRPNG